MLTGIFASARNIKTPVREGIWAWHDAADASHFTLEGGSRVVQWNDISGNNRHLARETGVSQRPVYGTRTLNGRNVVDFNSADAQSLFWNAAYGSFASATNNTTFIVARSDTTTASTAYCLIHARDTDSASQSFGMMIFINAQNPLPGNYIRSYHHDNDGTDGANRSNAGNGLSDAPHIYGLLRNGSGQQAILDDVLGNSAPAIHATPTGAIWLGGRFSAGSIVNNFDGIIAEVLIYNRALSAGEISQNCAYLNAKWGL